jgi:hypothetical protein
LSVHVDKYNIEPQNPEHLFIPVGKQDDSALLNVYQPERPLRIHVCTQSIPLVLEDVNSTLKHTKFALIVFPV